MVNGANKYLTQQVMTAGPATLVFMLYERAIGSLREAIAAIEKNDIEGRWRANARAVEIITHMWTTLDLQNGGPIAASLDSLFPYMLRRLPDVDFKNDPAPALEVIDLLEPLRDSWKQIVDSGNVPQSAGSRNGPPAANSEAGRGAVDAEPVRMRTSISA